MTDIFRTFLIPYDIVQIAVKITDALDYPDKGMFTSSIKDDENIGFISTGLLSPDSYVLKDAQTIYEKVSPVDPTISLNDCILFVNTLDNTEDDPFERIEKIVVESGMTVDSVEWQQPLGAHDSYPKDSFVNHNNKVWVSLVDGNVWEPGLSGWRETWGNTGGGTPSWIQPTGAHDAYGLGFKVTHNNKTWVSKISSNVWEPGVVEGLWEELDVTPTIEPWVQPTGAHDAYNIGDQVSFNGSNYQSVINGNVWSPTAYPAGWITI